MSAPTAFAPSSFNPFRFALPRHHHRAHSCHSDASTRKRHALVRTFSPTTPGGVTGAGGAAGAAGSRSAPRMADAPAAGRGRPVVVADVLGTLVRDPFFHGMAGHFGFASFESFLAAKAPAVWPQFELGELSEDELSHSFFRRDVELPAIATIPATAAAPAVTAEEPLADPATTPAATTTTNTRRIDVPALKEFMRSSYVLLPGVAELLRALRAARVPVHLCTNYPAWTDLVEDATRLEASFAARWTFVSARERLRKPHRDAYVAAARLAAAHPADCLFVDDRPENCAAAADAGFAAAVHFRDAAQAATELARLLADRGVALDISAVLQACESSAE